MSGASRQDNRRGAARKRVTAPIAVTDDITGQAMGHLGNLSSSGLLLIGPQTPRSEALYQLRVALEAEGQAATLVIGVQEQWHEPAASGQIWSGYRIVAIGEDDVALLHRWLASA